MPSIISGVEPRHHHLHKPRTTDQLQAFVRAAAGHRLVAAFWVAAFTGMRRNELLGLRWDDFDRSAATLSINPRD